MTERFHKVGVMYRQLTTEQKAMYKLQAETMNDRRPTSVLQLTDTEKRRFVRETVKEINLLVSSYFVYH